MNIAKRIWHQAVLPGLGLMALVGVLISPAAAETYFGASVGGSFGSELADNRASGIAAGVLSVTGSDIDLDPSVAFGFRLGHYFSFLPWLGVEFQWYTRQPDASNEPFTVSGGIITPTGPYQFVGTGTASVKLDNIDTWGFMVNVRAPEEYVQRMGGNIEPYVGVGLALNAIDIERITLTNTAGTVTGISRADSDVDTGFLGQLGVNYRLTERLDGFLEYKYTSAAFSLVKNAPGIDTRTDFSDHTVMLGLKFTFVD